MHSCFFGIILLTGPFSCGQVEMSSTPLSRSIINPRSSSSTNSNNTLQDSHYDDNTTDIYDYYDLATSDSDLSNTSVVSAVGIRSLKSDSNSSISPGDAATNGREGHNLTETSTEKKQLPPWAFFPTLPTVTAQDNTDQRIVGGDEALPGEIPWQVL